jgi:hypothetical protein
LVTVENLLIRYYQKNAKGKQIMFANPTSDESLEWNQNLKSATSHPGFTQWDNILSDIVINSLDRNIGL